jgi:6-pyruvoyltetrahydropterin/6-carboxytetrahydropterin synthase
LGSISGRRTAENAPLGASILDRYELLISTDFAAAHRLREYDGNCERLHGHNWKVDVVLRADALDDLGMALDFREAKRLIGEVLERFDHQYLNEVEPFDQRNPTTENIARTIFERLAAKLPDGVSVARVTAWESEGCGASYARQ